MRLSRLSASALLLAALPLPLLAQSARPEKGPHPGRLGPLALDPERPALQRRQMGRLHPEPPGRRRRIRRPRHLRDHRVPRPGRLHRPPQQRPRRSPPATGRPRRRRWTRRRTFRRRRRTRLPLLRRQPLRVRHRPVVQGRDRDACSAAWRAARAQGGAPAPTAVDTAAPRLARHRRASPTARPPPIAGVRSFRLPKDNGKWLVYSAPDTSRRAAGDSANRGAGGARQSRRRSTRCGRRRERGRRQYGTAIVLRNLDTGAEERLDDVLAYTFDDSAKVLAYTVVSRDSTKDGAFSATWPTGTTQTLLAGRGNYRAFTFDHNQQQFVFTSDRDEFGKPNARATLYYGTLKGGKAESLVASSMLPKDMRLADNAPVTFTRTRQRAPAQHRAAARRLDSRGLARRQGGVRPLALQGPAAPADAEAPGRARAQQTYQAIYNLAHEEARPAGHGLDAERARSPTTARRGIASTSVAYNIERMWGDGGNDVYVVDPATGTRKLIKQKITGQAQLSTDGKYVIFFDNGHWYTYAIATGKTVDITAPLQERALRAGDAGARPTRRPPGASPAGRRAIARSSSTTASTSGSSIPTGVKPAVVVTDSFGRRENLVVPPRRPRARSTTTSARSTRPKPLMAPRVQTKTRRRAGSTATSSARKAEPEKIVMADLAYGAPLKARERRRLHGHEEHVHRLPEPLGRAEPDVAHEDLRREPAAEGLQLGHRGARDVDERPTACRSRASSTSRRTSIRPRSIR